MSKEQEICQKIEQHNIDVMFLQEVDIDESNLDSLHFPGFSTYTHKAAKIRACTMVRNGTFKNISVKTEAGRPEVWLQVEEKSGRKTILANVYREWTENQQENMTKLEELIMDYSKERLIVAGDFNLDPQRLDDPLYGSKGLLQHFLGTIDELGFERTTFGHTFHRVVTGRHISSELDWMISNCQLGMTQTVKSGMSDHSMIIFDLDVTRDLKKEIKKVRNMAHIDIIKFQNDLARQPWGAIANRSIDDMALGFNNLFLDVLDKHAPMKEVTMKQKRTPAPSAALKKLQRLRDNARSKGQTEKLRHLRKECIKLMRQESMILTENRIKKGSGEVWKMVRELTGKSEKEECCIKKNGLALDSGEAAEEFNDFFVNKIKTVRDKITHFKGDRLSGAKKRADIIGIGGATFNLKTIDEDTVIKAIKKSKHSSCPDIYGISPSALKLAPESAAVPLTYIINTVIREGIVPEAWKIARIIPLHKKKEKEKVENYRPVSILPSASKIMEEIIRQQLTKFVEKMNILPTSQYGFRANRSTVQAAGAVHHDWCDARMKGLQCGALFFDLTAAFDTLDRDLLIDKLRIYGAGFSMLNWLKSYLSGRRQVVELQGKTSKEKIIDIGCPQGSVISPLLFLIMVADIEEWVSEAKVLTYADDTSCYASAPTREEVRRVLEKSAKNILTFMSASLLAANPTKTKFIMFGRQKELPLSVGDSKIVESEEEELLGITFNKHLRWSAHVNKSKRELKKRIGILKRLSFKLPRNIMCNLIGPIFVSKLQYALPLICSNNDDDAAFNEFKKLYRQALKTALQIFPRDHVKTEDLLVKTRQKSLEEMLDSATGNIAWGCLKNWCVHPLTANRIDEHSSEVNTRQRKMRQFPPQRVKESLVSKMVEVWESMPANLKSEENDIAAKKKVKLWARERNPPHQV